MVHYRSHERTLESQFFDDIAQLLLQIREGREQCKLLGNWFGYVIQLALGVVAFLSLVYKRWREVPRRELGIWGRDVSKQALGAFVAHLWNLAFAKFLQSNEDENECVLYFINFVVDVSLGLLLNYLCLLAIESVFEYYGSEMMKSGFYGNPPSSKIFLVQAFAWCICVTVVKVTLLLVVMFPLKEPFYDVGKWLMSGFDPYPRLELVVIMIIIPLILNILMFWIQDNFLMDHNRSHRHVVSSDPDLDPIIPPKKDPPTSHNRLSTNRSLSALTPAPVPPPLISDEEAQNNLFSSQSARPQTTEERGSSGGRDDEHRGDRYGVGWG